MKRIIMAACIISLAACGGDKDDVATEQQQDWESQKQSLVYSFPDNGQAQVPVPSPVVLRFSSPVMATSPAIVLREVGGPVVSEVEMEWVDGKRGLIITPDSALKPLTEYLVQIPEIELEKGTAPAKNIRFETRALFDGPRSLVAQDTFEVTRVIPDGENYPVMDFSSFRIQFSQPLDQTTVKYGNTADSTVRLVGPQGVVDAYLLVDNHYMTVDPRDDLTPGAEYFLEITTGVSSIYGDSLPGGSFGNPNNTIAMSVSVQPKDTTAPGTGERVSMIQDVADTGELSPLTGKPINLVPMSSILLGKDTATQAKSVLAAELAFVPNFPDRTPFRVKRGSLIEAASIDVLIGGEVAAGFESGAVRMDFLSDATGYLLPNPYSNADDAPRQVRLFMDVAVSTETPSANGAITQNLLHIELVGTSIVEDGMMVINAVGMVEPEVLGAERATGLLSFYMKAFDDQDNPPSLISDTTAPSVQSWVPGSNVYSFNEIDPIIINFNEPVDISGDALNKISLLENGQPIDFTMRTRGSALIVQPNESLKRSAQDDVNTDQINSFSYTLKIEPGLPDIAGNEISSAEQFEFELPARVTQRDTYKNPVNPADPQGYPVKEFVATDPVQERSPMITAVYPGFPCVLDEMTLDLAAGISGRCKGMLDEVYSRSTVTATDDGSGNITYSTDTAVPAKLADDLLPVSSLPANRPIVVIMSKLVDPNSVSVGGSFSVEEIDNAGTFVAEVPGDISVDGKKISFHPNEPWEVGKYYRYVIGSNGSGQSSVAICDGTESVCDIDGYPVQTQLYSVEVQHLISPMNGMPIDLIFQNHNIETGGGEALVQYFVGAEKSDAVLQVLSGPSSDINANMVHEHNKPVTDPGTYRLARDTYGEYEIQEPGAEGQPIDPHACLSSDPACLDPDGIEPPPNSAKLMIVEEYVTGSAHPMDQTTANVGCAFDSNAAAAIPFQKSACPENKFTYLTSSLVAEVGEYDEELGGVLVKIWPGQIMATALPMFTVMKSYTFEGGVLGIDSGPQIMRMRYAKQDENCIEDPALNTTCLRNKPIQGVIREVAGRPVIYSTVDVYVDAIDLQRRVQSIGELMGLINSQILHDVVSAPITLNLEGDVEFNDDGTMRIKMFNINQADIPFNLKFFWFGMPAPIADLTLRLPEYGNRIDYVSEIIK